MHNYDDYTFCIFLYNLFTVFWICIIFLNLKVMNTLNSFLCISSSSNHTFQGTFPEHMQTFCIIIFWNTMSVILITSSIEMSNHLLSVYNLPESHCSVIHRIQSAAYFIPNSSMLKCPILKHALCFPIYAASLI